jgi:hypothetical protein
MSDVVLQLLTHISKEGLMLRSDDGYAKMRRKFHGLL